MADLEALNVMVVDDSPIIIRKLTALLNTLGYVVVKTAENGVEAVETYEQYKPDVVTMDVTMPEMDGIEATQAIMSKFPEAKIVMVTSHGQETMVLNALKAGAKGYILKPFHQQKVYETIQKVCNRKIELQFF
ncbi:MAG: response regulator [Methylococcales bacterium]|jgi:two-component system chemotaxis response regulator CheY